MTEEVKKPEELVEFVEGLKRRWMATVDALIDPLMIVGLDYEIVKANRALADLAASDVKSVLGRKCYEAFAGRSSPCPGCKIKETAESRTNQQYELDSARPHQHYEVTAQPIFENGDELTGVLHVYRDRTEAKRLQQQLLQSEKLASIGLLAGGIAHEINNPLGGILIFSQMLLKEMDQESPHYQDVVEIEAATQRCKAIVENLLDFARQQPGIGRKEELEDVDLKEAVLSALRFGQVGLRHHTIDVVKEWADEAFVVRANRNKIIQLFLNLIQNAFQAMPDGGTITLSSERMVRDGKPMAAFEVRDTGVGISAEDQKRIFDPFYTSKGPGEGTGLGLAICYGIAEDLGGSIEVESVINRGSTFRLLVPIDQNQQRTA